MWDTECEEGEQEGCAEGELEPVGASEVLEQVATDTRDSVEL